MKASAWYYQAYQKDKILSFAWIMTQLMCDLVQGKQIVQDDQQALKRIGQSLYNQGYADLTKWAEFDHLTIE